MRKGEKQLFTKDDAYERKYEYYTIARDITFEIPIKMEYINYSSTLLYS